MLLELGAEGKTLTHLKSNSRESFQEIAKCCLTSVPTVKSRVDRLLELGVISKFTKDYFFCCTTCQGEFEKKYVKLLAKA
jgi:hypothetical protein